MDKASYYRSFISRNIKIQLKKCFYIDCFEKTVCGHKILSPEAGNTFIYEKLNKGDPFFAGRIGSSEMSIINKYFAKKAGVISNYPKAHKNTLCNNAGFFPNEEGLFDRFAEEYINSFRQCDCLALLGLHMENGLIAYAGNQQRRYITLTGLEPYYFENPWSRILRGKRVLIIHPFEDDIINQYKRRKKIFHNQNVLPEFNLHTLKAVQSIAGMKVPYSSWFEALDTMSEKAINIAFDIALVGCGAYGFPLAARLKQYGKQVIHMGGATQLLFGIYGSRWENTIWLKENRSENWIRPTEKERPVHAETVENACYW